MSESFNARSRRRRIHARHGGKQCARSSKAYVGNFTDNTVSVIDTSTAKRHRHHPGRRWSARNGHQPGWQHGLCHRRRVLVAQRYRHGDRPRHQDGGRGQEAQRHHADAGRQASTRHAIWRRPHRAGRYRYQRRRRNDTSSQASYRIGRAKRQACLCDIAGAWPFRSRRDRSWLAQRRADRTARQNAARRRIWR